MELNSWTSLCLAKVWECHMKYKTCEKTLNRKNNVYRVKMSSHDYPRITWTVLEENPNIGKQGAKAACVNQDVKAMARRTLFTLQDKFASHCGALMRLTASTRITGKNIWNFPRDSQPLPWFVRIVFKSIWLHKKTQLSEGCFGYFRGWLYIDLASVLSHS